MLGRVDQRVSEEPSPFDLVLASEFVMVLVVRRPKPLIPLSTALDKVSNSSSTSFFIIPAVFTLTRIAIARNGERITSIATDAIFLVVLVFISSGQVDQ